MANRDPHKGPFSVVQMSGMVRRMVEHEEAMRASGQKPGSVVPELFEMMRQFCVQHAEEFDAFVPQPRRK